MTAAELIEQLAKANPNALQGIPADKAAAMISLVFRSINDALARADEGMVPITGLGRFRVRRVERQAVGKRVKHTQILFHPGDPAQKRVPKERRVAQGQD